MIEIHQPGKIDLLATVCGHIAMYLVNLEWPTLDTIDFLTFEDTLHQVFPIAGRQVDFIAWAKTAKIGGQRKKDLWAYGESMLHVVDIQFHPIGEDPGRSLLPTWNMKGRKTTDLPFVRTAISLLGSGKPAVPPDPKVPSTGQGTLQRFEPGWPVPIGFANAGETCATSVTLQFVLATAEMTDALLQADCKLKALCKLLQKVFERGVEPTLTELRAVHAAFRDFLQDNKGDSNDVDASEIILQLAAQHPNIQRHCQILCTPMPAVGCTTTGRIPAFPNTPVGIAVPSPADSSRTVDLEELINNMLNEAVTFDCDTCVASHTCDITDITWPQLFLVAIERQQYDFVEQKGYTSRAAITIPRLLKLEATQYEVLALASHSQAPLHWVTTVQARSKLTYYHCNDAQCHRQNQGGAGSFRWPVTSRQVALVLYRQTGADEEHNSDEDSDYEPSGSSSETGDSELSQMTGADDLAGLHKLRSKLTQDIDQKPDLASETDNTWWGDLTLSIFGRFLKSILSPLKDISHHACPARPQKWVSRKTHYSFLHRKLVNERTINAPPFTKQLQRSKHEPTVSDFHCQAYRAESVSCNFGMCLIGGCSKTAPPDLVHSNESAKTQILMKDFERSKLHTQLWP